jgi:exopolysaccharide biosynthesis WecB/TagA/CpsF family protein
MRAADVSAYNLLDSPDTSAGPKQFDLFGVTIDNLTMDEALREVTHHALGAERRRYAFVNADCLNHAGRNMAYARVLSRQSRVFADGSGVALAARLNGVRVRGNVNGTDMFPMLCAEAASLGLRIFLLGGGEGVAQQASDNMRQAYPGLQICGVRHGYFNASETDEVIKAINAHNPDIVLVGLGAPRQEMWIEKFGNRLDAKVLIGVGGLFDYYSGRIPRAPLWVRNAGCEWVWRLAQEPRRLFARYVIGNPLFVCRALLDRAATVRASRLDRIPVELRACRQAAAWKARQRRHERIKRLIDIAGAGAALAALSPLLGLTALAIRLESKGPVLFSQVRVGRQGEEFLIWKFRSMYMDAERRRAELLANSDRQGTHFKMKHDPRITRVGRIIRRLSIDELPQLWNVLNGTMSLVGPRPNLPSEVAKYQVEELDRLKSKPGITCTWQVSGRADLPWERQIELDLDYVYEPSLAADVKLMLKTIPAVLSGKGAY